MVPSEPGNPRNEAAENRFVPDAFDCAALFFVWVQQMLGTFAAAVQF